MAAVLLLTFLPLSGQEWDDFPPPAVIMDDETDIGGESGSVPDDDTIYVIRLIDYSVNGRTLPSALRYHGELKLGEYIQGSRNLARYVRRKAQLLMNQRALEFATIAYSFGDPEEDGAVPVFLLVVSRDSHNFIIFPKPLISSNTGLDITLKARDYNFLGTLNPLRIDLGYALDNSTSNKWYDRNVTEGTFTLFLDTDIPVRLFDLDFVIDFDNEFKFSKENIFYKNTAGLSVEVPVSFTTATFGFAQTTTVNEDNADVYEFTGFDPALYDRFERTFTASELYASWKIPTGIVVGEFGDLSYTPRLSGEIKYRPGSVNWDPGYLRRGFVNTLTNTIGFDRIDWIENYRRGLAAYLEYGVSYNYSKEKWGTGLAMEATGHLPITSFFGISGQFRFNHVILGDTNSVAGEVLRGVSDKNIHADTMASLNIDFPFRVLTFLPSQRFNNSKFHFFDFEMHVSPIVDLALRWDEYNSGAIPEAAAGVEVILFPFYMRRVFIRMSVAFNLKDIIQTGKVDDWEYFIGLDHHF
jgi:hypothetical protein